MEGKKKKNKNKCWECCCGGGGGGTSSSSSASSSSSSLAAAEAVVLVSGIAGSILNAKKKKLFFIEYQTRVWVRLFLADLEFRNNIWSLYNPLSGYTEQLDDRVEIVVPEDDYGLHAIDILDPSPFVKLTHLSEVYHFHDMINMLIDYGYKKGTTLFGYGYDFRQSNRIGKAMDGLRDKLETAYKATGKKVNLISHSMGGLLVKCFMSLHNDVFSKYVNKWITIATPFQGAPGCINDSLLTGLEFVEGFESFFFVSRWTMHQLLVECPAIYEMLPNPEFNWRNKPQIQVWRKKQQSEEEERDSCVELDSYGPKESPTLFEEALRHNELKFNGKTLPLPFNFSILEWAAGTRKVLKKAKLPNGVSFYNIYGTSFDTPFDVCYGSESSPIDDLSEVCHSMPHYSFVDGDGTVPAESAKADGFAAVERAGVVADHRGLLCDKTVFELLRRWLGVVDKVKDYSRCSKVVDVNSGEESF